MRKKKVKLDTFCKVIVTASLVHGMTLSTLSYVLAFMDKNPVVEVSTVLVTEILAPVITYLATNMIANIFEKNALSFSIPLDSNYVQSKKTSKNYER